MVCEAAGFAGARWGNSGPAVFAGAASDATGQPVHGSFGEWGV